MSKVIVLVDGVIFDRYPRGGIARIYRELLPRIAEKNSGITFYITCSKKSISLLPVHKQIRPLQYNKWNFRPARLFSLIDKFRKKLFRAKLKRLRLDIFHSTYYTRAPIDGLKKVVMVYDLIDYQYPLFMPNGPNFVHRQKKFVEESDHIIGISQATLDLTSIAFDIKPEMPLTKMHLAASSVFRQVSSSECKNFKETYTVGRPFFLFVGSTEEYKNLATVIRALGYIRENTEHILVLAGHSMDSLGSSVADLAIECKVEDRIVRLAHPADETLNLAYNAADALVFPSLQEGFGIPLVEAMRCGTPIIASDIPVFREVCGEAARYFDPHSTEELAELMSKIPSTEKIIEYAERAIDRGKKYSWDIAAEILFKSYLDTIKQAAR